MTDTLRATSRMESNINLESNIEIATPFTSLKYGIENRSWYLIRGAFSWTVIKQGIKFGWLIQKDKVIRNLQKIWKEVTK